MTFYVLGNGFDLHYGLPIINRECTEEICRKVSRKYDAIAKLIIEFVDSCMEEYVKLGFYGADFSENTLRWQLSTIMWRTIRGYAFKNVGKPEKTGWGEHAVCVITTF